MATFYDYHLTPAAEAAAYTALMKQECVPLARQQSRMNGFYDGWAAARQADTDAGVKRVKADDGTVSVLAAMLYTQAVGDLIGPDSEDLQLPQWDHLHPSQMGKWERRAKGILESLPRYTQL